MSTVIEVDDVWKKYRLGIIGTGTLRHDFERWWHRVRGKPDPHAKVGETANRSTEAAVTAKANSSPRSAELRDDEVWALRGVSFEVKQGEILGIIGRNGAGKSTLLKILSRVTSPTKGEVRIKGRIASLLEVGTGFHPELTGRENIFLNGAILGMTKAEIRTKLDEIVAFAEIDTYVDTPVKRYSSGMYVRLAFAVAAHLEPEILIVDEVLAVGDAEFQKKCLGKMGEVAHGGRTVLFVSHNLSAIANVCQSAVLLHFGQLIFYGSVSQAIGTYSSSVCVTNDVNLTDYPGRVIDAGAFFQRLTLLNSDDRQVNHFPPLSEVILRINVRAFSTIRGARIGVAFVNWKGERVFAIATYMGSSNLLIPEGEAAIRVRFRLPALFPGRYQLEIGAYDSIGQRIDEIYGAGTMEIEDVNFLKMTHPVGAEMGHVMVSSEWTVEESKACQRNSVPLVN